MFELLLLLVFAGLFIGAVRLAFRVTWGLAKLAAVILFVVSLPTLIGCVLLIGGAILLVPVAMVAIAWGILRACVERRR